MTSVSKVHPLTYGQFRTGFTSTYNEKAGEQVNRSTLKSLLQELNSVAAKSAGEVFVFADAMDASDGSVTVGVKVKPTEVGFPDNHELVNQVAVWYALSAEQKLMLLRAQNEFVPLIPDTRTEFEKANTPVSNVFRSKAKEEVYG